MDSSYNNIYFLGIGGIGMSALARYFKAKGCNVAGYDRTRSRLTEELENEGIEVMYDEDLKGLKDFKDIKDFNDLKLEDTLVVRTPAVPEDELLYACFRQHGFRIIKRSELLGMVTRLTRTDKDGNIHTTKTLCVAGTHGKTTCSTMLAHIMHQSAQGASAFLGGISENYHSNLIIDDNSDFVVAEADEYDRSFHRLTPYISLITSIEPDHLDIYGTAEGYQEGFDVYAGKVSKAIVIKQGFSVKGAKAEIYTYCGSKEQGTRSKEQGLPDFYADNIRVADGRISFDFRHPDGMITGIELGVPVWINIENAVGAMAVALLSGATEKEIRKGVWRRFNRRLDTPRITYIDDYAHHPTEIASAIQSARLTYPDRHLIAVFQPHLYSRTRDFADGFARSLCIADEVILLPVYPAREEPIEGVTSDMLAAKCRTEGKEAEVVEKNKTAEYLKHKLHTELSLTDKRYVVMTLGAGDIDREAEKIEQALKTL